MYSIKEIPSLQIKGPRISVNEGGAGRWYRLIIYEARIYSGLLGGTPPAGCQRLLGWRDWNAERRTRGGGGQTEVIPLPGSLQWKTDSNSRFRERVLLMILLGWWCSVPPDKTVKVLLCNGVRPGRFGERNATTGD